MNNNEHCTEGFGDAIVTYKALLSAVMLKIPDKFISAINSSSVGAP